MLSARRLKLIRKDAYIVNTSRGEVIDENELSRLIEQGAIAGAGLDVFEHEPAVNPRLIKARRAVLMPHMGYGVQETWDDFYPQSLENALAFLDGKPVRVTNPEVLKA